MNAMVLLVLGAVVVVGAAVAARRTPVPVPVVLVLVGVGLSFVPDAPTVTITPSGILEVVLPPVLYAAAVQVRIIDLRRDWPAVAALAVLLVLLSAAAGTALLLAVLPTLPAAAAVAVAAVVSPPDAVAAISVGRRLHLPVRIVTLLEGEGLLNDAVALVLLSTALGALVTSAPPSPSAVAAGFGYTVVVSIATGVTIGAATVLVRRRLADPTLDVVVSLVTPFAASAVATAAGASGVLAVVLAGFVTGRAVRRTLSAAARLRWQDTWTTIQFLLENGVFLLIGLQLRSLLRDVTGSALDVRACVGIGLLLALVLAATRLVAAVPLTGVLVVEDRLRTRTTGSRFRKRDGVILGWAGMRGVVSLAAAQTLPGGLPLRPQLLLIVFVVVITTLVAQASTLPLLIRLLRATGDDHAAGPRRYAEMLDDVVSHGLGVLDDPARVLGAEADVNRAAVEAVRERWRAEVDAAREAADATPEDLAATPFRIRRRLSAAVLGAGRDRLNEIRRTDRFPSSVVNQVQATLDEAERGGVR